MTTGIRPGTLTGWASQNGAAPSIESVTADRKLTLDADLPKTNG